MPRLIWSHWGFLSERNLSQCFSITKNTKMRTCLPPTEGVTLVKGYCSSYIKSVTFFSSLCAQISHKNQWKPHLCNRDQNAANSSSNLLTLPGLINLTVAAQEEEDRVMSTAAQAKSWMNHPDHSALWFIRQLRNFKFLDVITTGAELQGVPNQRGSHCT